MIPPTFTTRQREVMDGIRRGQSYKEIGRALHMSPHTVRAVVIQIAVKIDDFPELPPRWRILAYAKFHEWQDSHATHLPRSA